MSVTAIIYLVLFVLMAIFHLYFSKKKDQYGRGLTKTPLLLLLMGLYLECVPDPSLLLIAALLFSWLGDVLLLGPGVKWFTFGGFAFWASHAFFIATYCQYINWTNVPTLAIIAVSLAFFIATSIVFKHLAKYLPKPLVVPMFLYLLTNGAMNCFAIFSLFGTPCIGSAITVVGALLFFVSDSSLFFTRFNKDSVLKSHFLAMLTYLLGEFLIVLGLMLF